MIHRASFLILLSGCSVTAPSPRTAGVQPVVMITTDEAPPAPSMVDTMRERMLCNERCPPLDLDGPPPSGFELTLWRCGRDFTVRVTSHGTVLRERHGKVLAIDHIEPAEAQALVRRFESAGKPVERRRSVVKRAGAMFNTSVDAHEYVTLERGGGELTIVGPPCTTFRDAFPLADEMDRVAHVID